MKTKDIIPPAIEVLYPILIGQVKGKSPILTGNIPHIQPAVTNIRGINLLKATHIFQINTYFDRFRSLILD
jgi:hypothetical protein